MTDLTYKQRERIARGFSWRRDLAIEVGLWPTAVIYEQKLSDFLRPGERVVGRDVLYSEAWL